MTKGGESGILRVQPPRQYPQAVWDELIKQGRLKYMGHGCFGAVVPIDISRPRIRRRFGEMTRALSGWGRGSTRGYIVLDPPLEMWLDAGKRVGGCRLLG